MPTPFISICPHCRAKLKLKNPGLIGKQARCPSCQEKFVVRKADAASPKQRPAASNPKPASAQKPKRKPVPQPDPTEEDPWLNDDLDSFGGDEESAPKLSGRGAAPPPAVTGVSKKRKASSDEGRRKKRKKSSGGVSVEHITWVGWIVGGSIAGLLGAAVWGAIGAFTFRELGIIAWAIGGLVGFGVRVGAREEDVGLAPGLAALGIAVASVVLGKFLVVHFLTARLENIVAEMRVEDERTEVTEEQKINWIIEEYATDIEYEWEDQGRMLNTPDWETLPEDAPVEAYYDPEVWTEAENRWSAKSDEEKAAEILAYESPELDFGEVEGEMFKASFGPLDILWFILAAATAFKVGCGLDFGDDD